jgi:hypothetical protein
MIMKRCIAAFFTGIALFATSTSQGATLALWDFNDPSLGALHGAALPDSDGQTVWREAATDKSGNGNHLTTWEYSGAGFIWVGNSPLGDFSIKAAGSYPAAYTWSASNAPVGTDIESAVLNQFTIEGVFTATGSGNRTLVGRDGRYLSAGASANAALYFQIDGSDHPAFEFTDANSNRVRLVAGATVVDDNATWYHMAGVSDGSKVSLYLNHALIAETNIAMGALAKGTANGSDWHAGGWSVARGLWNGGHVDRWLGNIDALAISDTALGSNSFVLPIPAFTNIVPNLADVTNETVYIMCYHEGYYPAGGNSGVFLSWSTDGYKFYPMNDGHPVFVPPEFPGDDADNTDGYANLVRDPSITYGPDGLYHLVFTSDIHSRSFGYAESPDLVNWSDIKLVQIWENNTNTVGRTWAPEIYYDSDYSNAYMVAFSSDVGTDSLHVYYTTTTNFADWTEPQDLYRKPDDTTVIDGFVAKVGTGKYVIATAQNNAAWLADGPTPYGPWTTRASGSSAGGDEGPALLKVGSAWHLYYDNYGYGDNVFGMMVSTDGTTNWTDVTGVTDMPAKADVPDYGYDGGPPHHSTVFAAPRATLGAFMKPHQDSVTNLSSLIYRWSFNEPAGSISSGTTVTDAVSGVAAVVNGNRANYTGTGLLLPGDTTGTDDAAYLDLPNGIVSSLTNLTVEIWATPVASKNWQRLFSFGRTVEAGDGGGEWNGPATGGTSALNAMYWAINVGTDINKQNCAMRNYADSIKDAVSGTTMETVTGRRYHYVFTFEDGVGYFGATGGRFAFYRDGYQIGWRDVSFRLQDIDDVNNWLGRSQWSGDSNSNVEYDEVRIYSQALSWYDVYGHFLAGPDVPVIDSPKLQISPADGSVVVRWPGNAAGFSLKETGQLGSPTAWSTVTNNVETTTNGLQVTLPAMSEEKFFRLEK